MRVELLNEELIMFQDSMREFLKHEVVPNHEQWEKDGHVPKDIWLKAGENNFLGIDVPEKYGGSGIDDFRYNSVVIEEVWRAGTTCLTFSVTNDLVIPYLLRYANEEQKERWFPKLCSGETISALAMTEPSAGSDFAAIRTTAKLDGNHYILNGQKTFITNGVTSDLVIVACKTNPDAGHKGMSLLVLERGMEGIERGKEFKKIGLKGQDTAELFFTDVKVPKENLLGQENQGFYYMMKNLPQERMSIAVSALAAIETVLDYTIEYCKERKAFGKPIGNFQNSRFKLAEMKTEAEIGRIYIDDCIKKLNEKKLTPEQGAMAKWWASDLQVRVADQCLQLHGGYGYILEYPIARAFADARIQPIWGGTNEIMKEIIGRSLGL
mgnify:FL=1